jgi:hypothetical protein
MPRIGKTILATILLAFAAQPLATTFGDDTSGADSRSAATGSNGARHALDHPMPALKFTATPLSDVLDFIADTTGANFSVDWKALDAAHVAKDAPITLRLSGNVSLRKVLNMVLDQAAGAGVLTFYVDEGVIEITSQEASDKILYSRIYPIQDLLFQPVDYNNAPRLDLQNAAQGQSAGGGGGGGGGQQSQSLFQDTGSQDNNATDKANSQTARADEIIKLITDTVKPELWQVNGGTATISFYRGNLIVNAPRSIHEELESSF